MKKVVLTGGSKGLGKAIKDKLENTPIFGRVEYQVIDFSRTSGVDLTKKIPEFDCDILILNAGVWECNRNWDAALKLNLLVPMTMALKAATKWLKEKRKGHIIFILSNAAYQSFGNDLYSTYKSGLLLLARRLQKEKQMVSTISPGTIDTDFWDKAEVDNRKKGCMEPEVVADLVYSIIKAGEAGACVTELIVLPK